MKEQEMTGREMTEMQESVYIFAARYTHHRNTGGTQQVTNALGMVWYHLSKETRRQIEVEAYNEATANREDWERFFHWDENLPEYLT